MQKNRGLLAGMRQQLRVLAVRLTCPDLTRETVHQRKENLSRPYKVNICNHAGDASQLFFSELADRYRFQIIQASL
jgi:hypothetical protein